jgi:hypothetical protein
MRTLTVLSVLLLVGAADADEVVLTSGKTIQYRILKDSGDQIEVQTVDNQTISIPKKDVKEIKLVIPKAPLTGATFTGDGTSAADKPVNLLAMIDPKKHSITGEWRINQAGLTGGSGLLEAPYIPPTSVYDVEIVVERKTGDDEFNIGLVAEGKSFSFVIDWGKGGASGLSGVGGRRVYENETKVGGKQLIAKKPRTIICAVRSDRVVVLMDGKEFMTWVGDPKQLSHPSRTGKEQNLFLSAHDSSFSISKYIVTPRK